jgi:hypothetical protein
MVFDLRLYEGLPYCTQRNFATGAGIAQKCGRRHRIIIVPAIMGREEGGNCLSDRRYERLRAKSRTGDKELVTRGQLVGNRGIP